MYVGVDLGGTNIAVGVLSETGEILGKVSRPTRPKREPSEVINDIVYTIQDALDAAKINKSDIKAIGIGIPGMANKEGVVVDCVNLYWKNVPLRQPIEEVFGIPVLIENDATVAGLAEYEMGKMKGAESGVFITLGTGIGGGIVIDGKVRSGFNGVGSEIGHMAIGDNFYNCNCGQNGCLETFASSTAVIKYAQKIIRERNPETLIMEMTSGSIDGINGEIIFEAAKKGDEIANEVVDRCVKYLARGITNLIQVLDPEVIVLGGGIANAGEFLRKKVEDRVEETKFVKSFPVGHIKLAKLKNDAGIIGAAFLGRHL